jgi:hypothetical protein
MELIPGTATANKAELAIWMQNRGTGEQTVLIGIN